MDGKFLELSVRTGKSSACLGGLIGLIVSGVFVYLGFFVKSAPMFFGFLGAVFVLVIVASVVWALITTEQIRVAKDEIHLRRQTPWGPTNGTRIDATGVETVRIGKKDNQGTEGILIETDAGTTVVGTGLPSDSLEWLRNCILKVISSAG